MGASTVFIVLAAVLGVVYGLDLTKTESYYKNEAVVKSGNLLPTANVVDTSAVTKSTSAAVSKTTSSVNQENIVSSVSSNPTTIVGDSTVYRALAKRCLCKKEKAGCLKGALKGALIKSIKEKSCLCNKCNGMKTSETTENQGISCTSAFEKEALLNKNKLSASSYNEETKKVAINKSGTANVVSDVAVQNELTKSRNLENSVNYDSSYQSSGDNTVITDNINNVNQGYQSSGDVSTINSINSVKQGSQISSSSSAIKSNAELALEKEQRLSASSSSSSSRSSSYKSGYAGQYANQVVKKSEATEGYSCSC